MQVKKYTEERPWGRFERFTQNEPSTVKIITIKPDEEFSLQDHRKRGEFWHVISGRALVTVGDKQKEAEADDEFFIPAKTLHRMKALDSEVKFLEIAFGDFDEADIERVEDEYGRV